MAVLIWPWRRGPKVKSDHTKRFRANDFLWDGLPSQISVTNNKRVVGTFNFRYPHLTLKEGSKVKSDHINSPWFPVCLPSQTSGTNNKRVISTFKFGYPCLTLKEGPLKVKSDHTKRFPPHDFLQVGLSSQTSRINKGDISTFLDWQKTPVAAILFLKMRPKIFPDNILWLLIYTANLRKLAIIFFFIRAVMVKSLSTHCGYPVNTMIYSTVRTWK